MVFMLLFRVIVATHSRPSEHPTKVPHPERPSQAEGFFSVVSSTDHHPLNTAHFLPSPLPSLLPIPCPLFSNSFPCHTSKNSPVSPVIATLPKPAFITPVFATHPSPPPGGAYSQRSSIQPLSVPTLFDLSPFFSHSCALFCTYQKLNPFVFKRFRTPCKKPPGGRNHAVLDNSAQDPQDNFGEFLRASCSGLFGRPRPMRLLPSARTRYQDVDRTAR